MSGVLLANAALDIAFHDMILIKFFCVISAVLLTKINITVPLINFNFRNPREAASEAQIIYWIKLTIMNI